MSLSELAGLEAREEVSLVEACGRRGWLFDRVERKRKGCAGGGSRRCGLGCSAGGSDVLWRIRW